MVRLYNLLLLSIFCSAATWAAIIQNRANRAEYDMYGNYKPTEFHKYSTDCCIVPECDLYRCALVNMQIKYAKRLLCFAWHFNKKSGTPSDVLKTEDKFFFSTKYKIFIYKAHMDKIQCSETTNFPVYFNFNIQRYNFQFQMPSNLYQFKLKLKKAKYSNIMQLAKEYVPQVDMVYYNSLNVSEYPANGNDTDMTDEDIGD
ncbi:unnamed protein product [Psylliodes chrysocephalus]|uniref:Uncharacterized protein n=1 Tax=Psylliodes chrysocephalus TaxID=3402493 RepID=A0A9P0CQJ2_9CUCU|nr:unnamed protein product [Psylliodes chrysocephala]